MKEITALGDGQIFVFGSNLAGHHAGGAALTAKETFGAEEGVGEGLTGQCYAFPTLDTNLKQRTHKELKESVVKLFKTASEHPDKVFFLTKVGCGIAGYDEEYMKYFFKFAPENIIGSSAESVGGFWLR